MNALLPVGFENDGNRNYGVEITAIKPNFSRMGR